MKFEVVPDSKKGKKEEKRYAARTERGGKITLSEEELKAHEEALRKQKILSGKEGEKAVEELEKELEKELDKE